MYQILPPNDTSAEEKLSIIFEHFLSNFPWVYFSYYHFKGALENLEV